MNYANIAPNPTPGSLTVERADNSVEFSGNSRSAQLEALRRSPEAAALLENLQGMKGAFTGCLGVLIGIGALFSLGIPAIVLTFLYRSGAGISPAAIGAVALVSLAITGTWVRFAVRRLVKAKAAKPPHPVPGPAPAPAPALPQRTVTLPWSLRITDHEVRATEGLGNSKRTYRNCNPVDITRVFVNPQGYLVAQLGNTSAGGQSEMVLTGSLDASDAGWLQGTLSNLLGLDASPPRQSTTPGARGTPTRTASVPDGFTLDNRTPGVLDIHYRSSSWLAAIIIFTIFGGALGAMFFAPFYRQYEKILADPTSHWVALIFALIGLLVVGKLAVHCLQMAFGSMQVTATHDRLQVKKKIGFLGTRRQMQRHELQGFELLLTSMSNQKSGGRTRLWSLLALGRRPLKLFNRDSQFENSEWLGRTLADFYSLPFTRSSKKRNRSVTIS